MLTEISLNRNEAVGHEVLCFLDTSSVKLN